MRIDAHPVVSEAFTDAVSRRNQVVLAHAERFRQAEASAGIEGGGS